MSYWLTRRNRVNKAGKVNRLKRGFSRRAIINFIRLYDKYSSSRGKYYVTLPSTCPIKNALEES